MPRRQEAVCSYQNPVTQINRVYLGLATENLSQIAVAESSRHLQPMPLGAVTDVAIRGVVPPAFDRRFPFSHVSADVVFRADMKCPIWLLHDYGGIAENGDMNLGLFPCVGLGDEGNTHGGPAVHVGSEHVKLVEEFLEQEIGALVGGENGVPDFAELLLQKLRTRRVTVTIHDGEDQALFGRDHQMAVFLISTLPTIRGTREHHGTIDGLFAATLRLGDALLRHSFSSSCEQVSWR